MAPSLQELGLDRLSPEDRLAVAEALWDSVAQEAEAASLPAAQHAELERRLADSIARPEAVTSWEVIRARALARSAGNPPAVVSSVPYTIVIHRTRPN